MEQPDRVGELGEHRPVASENGCGLRDVCERFDQLAEAILATERSLRDGARCVDAGLVDERLAETYARRLANPLAPLPFRLPTVETLLRRARALLDPRRLILPAASEINVLEVDGTPRTQFRIRLGMAGAVEVWPVVRIYDVRFWGIDIRPDDPVALAYVDEQVWKRVLTGLMSDLASIAKIEIRFAGRSVASDLVLLAEAESEAFERLLVDILNAGPLSARPAPLAEDFLEKTDLRVTVPGLERRRGARVQVSMTDNSGRMFTKRSEIRAPEEFVHLSPWTLGEALADAPYSGLLTPELIRDAHSELGTAGAPAAIIARALRSLFLHAIRKPGNDPRGPAADIPPSVQALVQAYVAGEVLDSTSALRDNQAQRQQEHEQKKLQNQQDPVPSHDPALASPPCRD